MKKLFLAGALFGVLNFAQATSITFANNTTEHGQDAYLYLINLTGGALGSGVSIDSASLTFNNVTITAGGYNTFSYDIINRNDATADITTEGDVAGDYFTSGSYSHAANAVHLGTHTFTAVPQTWTTGNVFTFTGANLTFLNIAAADGMFDFGFDPDCTYSIGSVTFTYTTASTSTNITTVPDSAMTAALLGLSFLGLLAFRRKLCIN
jgi:VPDSG-CTERM motif